MASQGDWQVGDIGRFEKERFAFLLEPLDRDLFSQKDNDDTARIGGVLLADNDVIPLLNSGIDHTVTLDL